MELLRRPGVFAQLTAGVRFGKRVLSVAVTRNEEHPETRKGQSKLFHLLLPAARRPDSRLQRQYRFDRAEWGFIPHHVDGPKPPAEWRRTRTPRASASGINQGEHRSGSTPS